MYSLLACKFSLNVVRLGKKKQNNQPTKQTHLKVIFEVMMGGILPVV